MTSVPEDSEILIRRARPEDYENIMAIGDVYGGRDYLGAEFHNFLNKPDIMYPIVAEVDGKAVGFYFNHIINGGRTVIKRAGRVHKSYRGQGIFHKLSDALDEQRKKAWPDVQYEVFATHDFAERADEEFREKGFVKLVKKQILNMVFRQANFLGEGKLSDFDHIKRMTGRDLKTLLDNEVMVGKLFPNGVIFNWYIGYRPMEANIRYFDNEDAEVYATTFSSSSLTTSSLSESSVNTHDVQNFTPEMINDIDIISCAHRHDARLGLGLVYEVDLYTVDGYSESVLREHIKKHIYNFRDYSNADGMLMITFNSNVNKNQVLSCLKEQGIVDFLPGSESYKVFYERKIA